MTEVNFYDKEQVDNLLEDKADTSSVGSESDAASASGSLWARIKYVLAHWMTKDSEQTVTAKKTFSVSPEVPTEPANDDSAVNSFYVNDSTGTVINNIAHKDGNENIAGTKKIDGLIETPMLNPSIAKSTAGNYMLVATLTRSTYYDLVLDMIGIGRAGFLSHGEAGGTVETTFVLDGPPTAPTDMQVLSVDNTATGLREIWIRYNPSARFYIVPKIYEIGAVAQTADSLEFPGTTSTADPGTLANRTNKIVGTSIYNGTVM